MRERSFYGDIALIIGVVLMTIVICNCAKSAPCPGGVCPKIEAVWTDATGKPLDIKPLALPAPPLPAEFCQSGKCRLPKVIKGEASVIASRTIARCPREVNYTPKCHRGHRCHVKRTHSGVVRRVLRRVR